MPVGAAIAAGVVAAGASVYSQSQQQKAAKKAQEFQQDPANRTTTQEVAMPPWLLPYAKANMERIWNDTSKPYKPYGGFFNNIQAAIDAQRAQQAARSWDGLTGPQPSINPETLPFKPKIPGIPFNPLTARPGEQVQLPISQKDYQRYLLALASGTAIDAMGGADQKAWKKTNKLLAKYMNSPIMLGSGQPYGGLLTNQFNQQAAPAPDILAQYRIK